MMACTLPKPESPCPAPSFAELLTEARERKGLSIPQLAALLGTPARNLKRLESGKYLPHDLTLEQLCEALEVEQGPWLRIVTQERKARQPRRGQPETSAPEPPPRPRTQVIPLLAPLAEAFLNEIEWAWNYSPHTVRSYRAALGDALKHFRKQGITRPGELTVEAVRSWLLALHKRRLSDASVAHRLHTLRSFCRYVCVAGVTSRNMAQQVYAPKQAQALPRWLTEKEAARLLDAPYSGSPETQARDRAMLELLYSAGLRVSELVGLDLDDVNLTEQTVRVLGKGSKERIVPVGEKALEALREYLAVSPIKAGAVFRSLSRNGRGSRLDVRSVRRMLAGRSKTVLGRVVNPHALRHSMASHLLDNGAGLVEIASLLGHVSIVTTQRYTHLTIESLRRSYEAHPRAHAPKPPALTH